MGEESSQAYDVFLSYASPDKTRADAACAVLERHRVRCWIAPRDITPGDEWGSAIIKGINGRRMMVLIFSRHANASGQVHREVERAISRGIAVLPMRIEDVRPEAAMEFALGNRHWLDAFTPPVERQLELLAQSVKSLLANDPGTGAAPAAPNSPEVVPPRRAPWVWPSVAVAVLMIGFFAAWMGGVFNAGARDGIIVLEQLPKDSEVLVDGVRISFTWPGDGKPVGIRAAPGHRKVEVKKDGFRTFEEDVTVKKDELEQVTVRLEPLVKERNGTQRTPIPEAVSQPGPRIDTPAVAVELAGTITKVDVAGKNLTITTDAGTDVVVTTTDSTEIVTGKGDTTDLQKIDQGLSKANEARKKGPLANVTHEKGVASKVRVAYPKKIDTPVIAEELAGYITKVDVAGKKLTITTDAGTDVVVTTMDSTKLVTGKGETKKLDVESLSTSLAKFQDEGKKGIPVKVTHKKGVTSKIQTFVRRKAAN